MPEPTEKGKVIVILTQMRGFLVAGGLRDSESRWLLGKVDEALAEYGVLDIVQGVHHDHLEELPAPVSSRKKVVAPGFQPPSTLSEAASRGNPEGTGATAK